MSGLKRSLLWLMGVFYIVAGTMHFVSPDTYMPMIPPYLPWHRELIFVSGVAEVLCGVGVLWAPTRRLAAWATIALLVAVFPANVHIAWNNVPLFGRSEGAGIWNWVRLPFQAVLILWAYWYARPEEALQAKRRDHVA